MIHIDGQVVVAALCVGIWLAVVAAVLVSDWVHRQKGEE